MPFPKAIAQAQRESFLAQVREQATELERIREELRAGEPHVYDMSPTRYFASIKMLSRAIDELRSLDDG